MRLFVHKNIEKENMIHDANEQFDFSMIHLGKPTPMAGGTFFTKINFGKKDESLYVYTPKCSTKQGIVTTGKPHSDFIFHHENVCFIEWLNALEERLYQLLYEKKNQWFVSEEMELDDIQNAFIPSMKIKGKQYILRGYIPQGKQVEPMRVFNELEIPIPMESIKEDPLIAILDISGIKFSERYFQLVIHIRQMMVLEKNTFSQCLIKRVKEKQERPEVKIDTLVLKTPREVYESALEKAKLSEEEAERSRSIAEELRINYEIIE
jgi:hypothetical protein